MGRTSLQPTPEDLRFCQCSGSVLIELTRNMRISPENTDIFINCTLFPSDQILTGHRDSVFLKCCKSSAPCWSGGAFPLPLPLPHPPLLLLLHSDGKFLAQFFFLLVLGFIYASFLRTKLIQISPDPFIWFLRHSLGSWF